MVIVNIVIDVFFLIDLILTFLTAYHTDDFETEDDYKVIAYNYLTGWFLIDLLAIIPFQYMMKTNTTESELSNSESGTNAG